MRLPFNNSYNHPFKREYYYFDVDVFKIQKQVQDDL
jgi:hypothetical protein